MHPADVARSARAATSMSTPMVRSTSATSSGSGASERGGAAGAARRTARPCRPVPVGRVRSAGPRSSSASTRLSARRVRSRRRPAAAAAAARSRSAARSRGPIRQRAPVSSRTSAPPACESASTRSVATTSTTSGVVSSPPSPTISTGKPASRSASASSGICERRRTSTAAVRSPGRHRVPCRAHLRSATQRASSSDRLGHRSPRRGPARRCAPAAARGVRQRVAQRRGDQVRRREDRAVVAEAGDQRVDGRRAVRRRAGRCVAKRADVAARSPRASRRSTGTGRRPRSPGARRRTGRAASRPARGRCPGTRRAARRGTAPARARGTSSSCGQLRRPAPSGRRSRQPRGRASRRCERLAPAAAAPALQHRAGRSFGCRRAVPRELRLPVGSATKRSSSAAQNRSTCARRRRGGRRTGPPSRARQCTSELTVAPMSPAAARASRDDLVGDLPRQRRRQQPGVRLGADPQRLLADQPAGVGGVGRARSARRRLQHREMLEVVGRSISHDRAATGRAGAGSACPARPRPCG